eukprot:1946880-Rhodomonas_salina.1
MRDQTRGMLMRNTIAESEGAGLVLQGSCIAQLFGNAVRDGKVSNVVALDNAKLLAVGNSIVDSQVLPRAGRCRCSAGKRRGGGDWERGSGTERGKGRGGAWARGWGA